jgi:hypothetical protein
VILPDFIQGNEYVVFYPEGITNLGHLRTSCGETIFIYERRSNMRTNKTA